jgi:hypothetical protein
MYTPKPKNTCHVSQCESVYESGPWLFFLTFANTVELSDHIRQLLDGLYLFLQVLAFDEISELRIIVAISQLVQVEKRLVDI